MRTHCVENLLNANENRGIYFISQNVIHTGLGQLNNNVTMLFPKVSTICVHISTV